jgi:two-component system response regulator TctD
MKLLVVEDSPDLSNWLSKMLMAEGYAVECSHDGKDASYRLKTQCYDMVLLNLGIPKVDGRSLLRQLRSAGNPIPVLILTASTDLRSRIDGLNDGADDCLGKPFDVEELIARMRALMRRFHARPAPSWQCGNLRFDSNTRQFRVGDDELKLTPREHGVLEMLMLNTGKTLSKDRLFASVYTVDDPAAHDAIEIYVHRLRKKLEKSSAVIVTLRGLGYLLKQKND